MKTNKISSMDYDFRNYRLTITNIVYPINTPIVDIYDKNTNIYRGTVPQNRIVN